MKIHSIRKAVVLAAALISMQASARNAAKIGTRAGCLFRLLPVIIMHAGSVKNETTRH